MNQRRTKCVGLPGLEVPDADWMVGRDASGHAYIMHLRQPRFLAKASLTDDGSLSGFSYVIWLDESSTRGDLMTLLHQAELAWKAWRDEWDDYDA